MVSAVATYHTATGDVAVALQGIAPMAEEGEAEETENPIIPIAPEPKELIWGFGSFVVFALLMRYFLYPRLRKGMDARYQLIKGGHDEADRITEAAQSDVERYEAQLAAVRAEAQARIEAARSVLDEERSDRLAEVNARIAERKAEAATEVENARAAAQAEVEQAVREVATRFGELALGRRPDPNVVTSAVAEVTGAGVGR